MHIRLTYLMPLFAAGAVAAAIAAAPIAAAAPTPAAAPSPMQQTCAADGVGTECQSPGNVEINDSPPPVSFDPYGYDGLLIGGWGGGFHGGFHGGGGGHR